MKRFLLPLLLAVTCATACSSEDTPPPAPPAANAQQSPPPADPEALAPVTSRTPAGNPGGAEIKAPGAVFSLPAHWMSEPPSSSMRLAQARIPGAGGDGQLTVFYFGAGGGGGLESNLSRWIGQVELEPGSEPRRESFDAGGFRVTWIEVEGTLKPSTMGVGPTEPQPGSRLLAAVVEGPQGPWYFKATGPSETLEAERDAFLGMLGSGVPNG